jgi:hypothetical protein
LRTRRAELARRRAVKDHPRVPHFWITVTGNPKSRTQLRKETRDAVKDHDATLIGNELFFRPGKQSPGHGTVKANKQQMDDIKADLPGSSYEPVETADEPGGAQQEQPPGTATQPNNKS